MKNDLISKVRNLKDGYGITGVQLNLNMGHIYSLMILKSEYEMALNQELDPRFENLAHQTLSVLNFIIGDIPSPMNPNLWNPED